jgi:hypothetical protein
MASSKFFRRQAFAGPFWLSFQCSPPHRHNSFTEPRMLGKGQVIRFGTHRTLYSYLPSALHVFDEHAFRVLAA